MPLSERLCPIAELQRLEEEAWASPVKRALYATRHIPGFPWHTVREMSPPREPSTADAVALFTTGVRRHVIPYDFSFTVFVKGRWVGRRLLEVYAEELPHHTPAYYEACLRRGRLYCVRRSALGQHNTQRRLLKRTAAPSAPVGTTGSVSGNALSQPSLLHTTPMTTTTTSSSDPPQRFDDNCLGTSPVLSRKGEDVVLQHGDVVYHTVHRHEMPVTVGVGGADAVVMTAVCITDYGLICVNKPTGLPTHATGRYNYNSLTSLLEYVLAPKRLVAWLWDEDPLLQSLVSTEHLSPAEKSELYEYYSSSAAHVSCTGSVHQPCEPHLSSKAGSVPCSASSQSNCATETQVSLAGCADLDEVDPDKAPRPCHRLDKVTSGVLLLAVCRDAARRVGSILMRKAKEVEEAVAAELLRPGNEPYASLTHGRKTAPTSVGERTIGSDGNDGDAALPALCASALTSASPPESLQRVLASTYELQKYYLARVCVKSTRAQPASGKVGETETGLQHTLQHVPVTVPSLSSSFLSSRHIWHVSGDERYVTTHNARLSRMLSSVGIDRDMALPRTPKPMTSIAALPGVFPSGVLTTLPVPAPGALTSAAVAAATLCQCLSALPAITVDTPPHSSPQAGTDVGGVDEEAVVLCTPYTGRLHQIRVHLSSLGCPIVGDVVYAHPTGNASVASGSSGDVHLHMARASSGDPGSVPCGFTTSFTEDKTASDVSAGVSCAARLSKENRAYVFFDAAQLPAAYHRFCEAAKTVTGGFDATAAATSPPPPPADQKTLSCRGEARAVKVGTDGGPQTNRGVKRSRTERNTRDARESRATGDTTTFVRQVSPPPKTVSAAIAGGAGAVEGQRNSEPPARWQDEPLCYECAGLLPIVAAGECATGTSAICLHAWVYQLKKDLLLASDDSALSKASSPASGSDVASIPPTTNRSPSASPSLSFPVDRETSARAGSCRAPHVSSSYPLVVDDDFVRFEAPPPAWLFLGVGGGGGGSY